MWTALCWAQVCDEVFRCPFDMSQTKTLTDVEQNLVEEFGNLYESHGFKRVQGLLVGLLLTQRDPLSLDDMSALLDRSKGPLSVAARRLADKGIIRKVSGPVKRRNYYSAHADVFYNNFKHNMETVRRNRAIAEQFLERLDQQDASNEREMRHNLKHMHAFYQLMESFYENFSEEWEKVKQKGFAQSGKK